LTNVYPNNNNNNNNNNKVKSKPLQLYELAGKNKTVLYEEPVLVKEEITCVRDMRQYSHKNLDIIFCLFISRRTWLNNDTMQMHL
jgi:hypothetical protein